MKPALPMGIGLPRFLLSPGFPQRGWPTSRLSPTFEPRLRCRLLTDAELAPTGSSATGIMMECCPMARIPEVDPDQTSARVKAVLDAQRDSYGAPLNNHLLYAHDDDIFRGVRGMWSALDKASPVGGGLAALVNRRVAALVGCEF